MRIIPLRNYNTQISNIHNELRFIRITKYYCDYNIHNKITLFVKIIQRC